MPTEKLLPMIEAATATVTTAATRTSSSIPITRTTSTIITSLSHGHNKRPTIIIYPTGKLKNNRTHINIEFQLTISCFLSSYIRRVFQKSPMSSSVHSVLYPSLCIKSTRFSQSFTNITDAFFLQNNGWIIFNPEIFDIELLFYSMNVMQLTQNAPLLLNRFNIYVFPVKNLFRENMRCTFALVENFIFFNSSKF